MSLVYLKNLEQVLGATTLLNTGCLLISCPSTYQIPSTWVIPLHQVGKGLTSDEAEALKVYLERFGDCRDGSNPGADCRVMQGLFLEGFSEVCWITVCLGTLGLYAIHRIISHATWDVLTKGNHAPLVIGTGYNRKAFPWYTAPAKQPERETLTSEAGGCIHHRNGVGIWCNSSSPL